MSRWLDGGMDEEGAVGGSDMGQDGASGRGEFRDLHGSTSGLKKQAISGRDLYVCSLPQIRRERKLKAKVIE